MNKILSFILICITSLMLTSPAHALGARKIDPNSPILTDSPIIAKIYEQSCIAGSNENGITSNFPLYEEDSISDQFQHLYPADKFKLWLATPFMVAAGYDLGRTLALTDMNGVDIEDTCKLYSINFAAVIVANPQNWNYPTPAKDRHIYFSLLFDNPFNDVLAPKQGNLIEVTPKVAEQNGCRYTYITLAKGPVIEVSPFDTTIDMMENMLWSGYPHDVTHFAYPYILQGAKRGQYLFQMRQGIQKCYE